MPVLDNLSLFLLAHFAIALPFATHCLLTKDQEAAAVGWIALVLVSPFVGSALYWVFGINRVARRAHRYRGRRPIYIPRLQSDTATGGLPVEQEQQLFRYGRAVHDIPYVGANRVMPLINGDAAYPDMLASLLSATSSICFSVYIFDRDPVGMEFARTLIEAHRRGVKVRILVDDIGSGVHWRTIDKELRAAGIPTARFIPQSIKFLPLINLRNHRKILIVDSKVGYIGSMNISAKHVVARAEHPIQDVQFRVTGPVVDQLSAIFEQDWHFSTGETLALPLFKGSHRDEADTVCARIVHDGPDQLYDRLQWIILGALAVAQKSVRIITPYFIPNEVLTAALSVCALRGVDVQVLVPTRTDITLVDWAMAAKFQRLLENGVKIFAGAPPFDHSKIMVVDGAWTFVGSTNWDQRSLRLNFEANLECYDQGLAAEMEALFVGKKATARAVSLGQILAEPLRVKIRNNLARLFAPYL